MNWKNILERAAWTFVQAFLAVFGVSAVSDLEALKSAAVAGVAAGVAALLSFIKTVAQERLSGVDA
jgi:phosphoribosylformimino-5-aminoimidazole carboxamide ribonucleotide (ProFAR) isomerase